MLDGLQLDLLLSGVFGVVGLVLLLIMPTNYYLVRPDFLRQFEQMLLLRGLKTTRKALLTPNEKEFMGRLQRAVPELHVMAQVSMGALMDIAPGSSPTPEKDRWRFANKIVDFVICHTRSREVIALVELDDRTHDNKKDADAHRDALTAMAGYPTLRWDSRRKPSEKEIRAAIRALAHT